MQSFLHMVPVRIIASNGESVEVVALLETGSMVSMVIEQVCNALGLEGVPMATRFRTFHDKDSVLKMKLVSFTVSAIDGKHVFKFQNFYATHHLKLQNSDFDLETAKKEWPHLQDIDLPNLKSKCATLLVGADSPGCFAHFNQRLRFTSSNNT